MKVFYLLTFLFILFVQSLSAQRIGANIEEMYLASDEEQSIFLLYFETDSVGNTFPSTQGVSIVNLSDLSIMGEFFLKNKYDFSNPEFKIDTLNKLLTIRNDVYNYQKGSLTAPSTNSTTIPINKIEDETEIIGNYILKSKYNYLAMTNKIVISNKNASSVIEIPKLLFSKANLSDIVISDDEKLIAVRYLSCAYLPNIHQYCESNLLIYNTVDSKTYSYPLNNRVVDFSFNHDNSQLIIIDTSKILYYDYKNQKFIDSVILPEQGLVLRPLDKSYRYLVKYSGMNYYIFDTKEKKYVLDFTRNSVSSVLRTKLGVSEDKNKVFFCQLNILKIFNMNTLDTLTYTFSYIDNTNYRNLYLSSNLNYTLTESIINNKKHLFLRKIDSDIIIKEIIVDTTNNDILFDIFYYLDINERIYFSKALFKSNSDYVDSLILINLGNNKCTSFANEEFISYDKKSNKVLALHDYKSILFRTLPDENSGINIIPNNSRAISIFPNPASNSINLILKSDTFSKTTIELFDMLGRKVKSFYDAYINIGSSELSFDISDVKSGNYQLLITKDNQSQSYPLNIFR